MSEYKAKCMKATCRYIDTYDRHPGAPKCPKCGFSMMVTKA